MSNGNFVGRREVSSTNTIQDIVVKENTIQLARHKSGSVLEETTIYAKRSWHALGECGTFKLMTQ